MAEPRTGPKFGQPTCKCNIWAIPMIQAPYFLIELSAPASAVHQVMLMFMMWKCGNNMQYVWNEIRVYTEKAMLMWASWCCKQAMLDHLWNVFSLCRYNPDNQVMFEQYVERQCQDNTYDLEANLALLKLYQFNPSQYNPDVTQRILLKAITNLPHTDIILCKCLLAPENVSNSRWCELWVLCEQLKVLCDLLCPGLVILHSIILVMWLQSELDHFFLFSC